MNILTTYFKICAVIMEPILNAVGLTRGLPDWAAFALLMAPLLAFGMLFPVATVVVCLILFAALMSMVWDMRMQEKSRE